MNKIIAVDFDGTLCENKWPDIGAPNKKLIAYLKAEQNEGADIILWTCRSGKLLDSAIEWCEKHDLIFNYVNENTDEAIKLYGTDTRKIFANIYIDDSAVTRGFNLPYVDKNESIQLSFFIDSLLVDGGIV